MDDLLHIKLVVNNTIVDLQPDERVDVKLALGNLFRKPLIAFEEAFDEFMGAVGGNSQAYDRWLNIQLNMFTDFGPDRKKLVERFKEVFKEVLTGTPGGESFTYHNAHQTLSYQLLLMIRVYGDSIPIMDAPLPGVK